MNFIFNSITDYSKHTPEWWNKRLDKLRLNLNNSCYLYHTIFIATLKMINSVVEYSFPACTAFQNGQKNKRMAKISYLSAVASVQTRWTTGSGWALKTL